MKVTGGSRLPDNKHMNKWIMILITVAGLFILIDGARQSLRFAAPPSRTKVSLPSNTNISAGLDAILNLKAKSLQALLKDEVILNQVQAAGFSNSALTEAEVLAKDNEWQQADGLPDFMKEKMINTCADRLFDFSNKNEEFAEIFVTDIRGLNVCQTTKTTDYYQADEQWWVDAFNGGRGHSYFGDVEYDESAHSQVIPIYIPVRLPETNEVIGICKALVDTIFLKEQTRHE